MTVAMRASFVLFSRSLQGFANRSKTDSVAIQKRVMTQVLTGIVLRTPVDTGTARGGWQVDIGSPTGRTPRPDKSGQATISEGLRSLDRLEFGETSVISNPVDYVFFLENGSSTQAPRGMVAITVDEVRATL